MLLLPIVLIAVAPSFGQTAEDYYNHGQSMAKGLCAKCMHAAIDDYTKAIQLKPDYADAYEARGRARISESAYKGFVSKAGVDRAIADFTKAIDLRPTFAEAYENRAEARALSAGGFAVEHHDHFRHGVEIKLNESISDVTKAIQLKPDYAEAYGLRGLLKQSRGDLEGALADYTKALQLDPSSPVAGRIESITAEIRPKRPALAAANDGNAQRLQITFQLDKRRAEAALVLSVSWMFAGSTRFDLRGDLSKITGPSGIAGSAFGPMTLSFSNLYTKAGEPLRAYFRVGGGELQLWWSTKTESAAANDNSSIQLNEAWLAASKEIPPTPEHPGGGLSISSATPTGDPLAFYVEFAPGTQRIKSMGLSFAATAQQPAISISTDPSGKTRTFLAGQVDVPGDMPAAFCDVGNKVFTCTLVQPLKKGDKIPARVSEDQGWSIATVPLLIGTNKVQYPILAMVKTSDGMRIILPAVLTFKIDIQAGTVLHSDGLDVETKRPVKAGDSIPVFFLSGSSILSVESVEGVKTGSATQPWFTAFPADAKSDTRQAIIEAWHIERGESDQKTERDELVRQATEEYLKGSKPWTDPSTGLMWTDHDNGKDVNWSEAMNYCAGLSLSGYSNWRLPTIDELRGIYDPAASAAYQYEGETHYDKIKGGITPSNSTMWSTTTSTPAATSAMALDFTKGDSRYSYAFNLRYAMRALCVRRSGE